MLRGLDGRGSPTEDTARRFQFQRIQDSAAAVALISPSVVLTAVRAYALDESIWKETRALRTEWKIDCLAEDETVVVYLAIEFLDKSCVNWVLGSCVVCEADLVLVEQVAYCGVILVRELLRRHSFLDCFNLDRSSMLVGSSDRDHLFAFEGKVS